MEFRYAHSFQKQFKKLPPAVQDKFAERLGLFSEDRTHPLLRVHPLKGKYAGYWSVNVTGDIRALYREDGEDIILFALIGTHSSLYG